MKGSIFSYHQKNSIKLLCEIDLRKLLPASAPKERENFDRKWKDFLESDPCNKDLFKLKADRLKYQSEQLIPTKTNHRLPLINKCIVLWGWGIYKILLKGNKIKPELAEV